MTLNSLVLKRYFEIFFLVFLFCCSCFLVLNNVLNGSQLATFKRQEVPKVIQNFNFNTKITQRLKVLLGCHDHPLIYEKRQYGDYWLLKNIIRGRLSEKMGCSEAITYCTNGDYTFFDNLSEVVKR